MHIRLEHIDAEKNKYRFYQISIEPNLFGDHSVVVGWGRIGSPARTRIYASGPEETATRKAELILLRKRRRGYLPNFSSTSLR